MPPKHDNPLKSPKQNLNEQNPYRTLMEPAAAIRAPSAEEASTRNSNPSQSQR